MARYPYDEFSTEDMGFGDFEDPLPEPIGYNPPSAQPPAPTMSPYGNSDLEKQFWGLFPNITPGVGSFGGGELESRRGDVEGLGLKVVGGDKIQLPDGTVVDVAGNYNPQGGGIAVWQDPRYDDKGQPYTPPAPSAQGGFYFTQMPGLESGFGTASGSSKKGSLFGDPEALTNALKGLFPGGAFNQDVVNRRTEGARSDLERMRKSRQASSQAALANRGLMGSGPEITAQGRQEEDIADLYSNAVSGIYADESQAADRRMMQALQIAAGLTSEEAQLLVDQFRAGTERDLGLGNLALGNTRAANEYNLGLGQYGLGRDRLLYEQDQADIDNYYDYLRLMAQLGGQSQEGYY